MSSFHFSHTSTITVLLLLSSFTFGAATNVSTERHNDSLYCNFSTVIGTLGHPNDTDYIPFNLSISQYIYLSNCDSDFDTMMFALDESFNDISHSVCDGDDCGDCAQRESFSMFLSEGFYFVQIQVTLNLLKNSDAEHIKIASQKTLY